MSIYTKFDNDAKDVTLYALNNANLGIGVPSLTEQGYTRSVSTIVPVGSAVTITGDYFDTKTGDVCFNCFYNNKECHIFRSDILENWTQNKQATAVQNDLNQLLYNNAIILERNLIAARMINLASNNNISIPTQLKKKLYDLQKNLVSRNEQLLSNSGITGRKEGYSQELESYYSDLNVFMNNPGITAIPVIVYIIVAAAVVITTATITTAIVKSLLQQSTVDIGLSADLLADLKNTLPSDVYKRLLKENAKNQKIVDNAISNASGKGILKTVSIIGAFLIGYKLLPVALSYLPKGKK